MKVKDIFALHQGNSLELMHLETSETSNINFVSRSAQNNGVVARVDLVDNIKPFPAGYVTVALGGSVLSSFVQLKPFYTAFHIMALEPKKEMTLQEKLFYCMCIKANAYRYGYGRQANKSLRDIELPDRIPKWVYNTSVTPISTKIKQKRLALRNIDAWKEFCIGDFFTVSRGERIVRDRDYFTQKTTEYKYSVITASKQNNGADGYYHSYNCPQNSIVCGGEAGGMFTTYQPNECWVMDRARIFTPKNNVVVNVYTAMFLVTLFSQNQYKYSYNRTPNPDGIEKTIIKLPVTANGEPDWDYMEKYIKALTYSDRI